MRLLNRTYRAVRPGILGLIAWACAILGLAAWFGYATFAMRGINAVYLHDTPLAYRMSMYSGRFSIAQLILGLFAVELGSAATNRGQGWGLAQGFGISVFVLGVFVLLLLFLLV